MKKTPCGNSWKPSPKSKVKDRVNAPVLDFGLWTLTLDLILRRDRESLNHGVCASQIPARKSALGSKRAVTCISPREIATET